jgi:hypothetical protein
MSREANPATADTPQVLLEHHLKQLRLPTFLREYDKVARQCAAESVDYPRYLLRLTEQELLDRERRATERRIHQARFPVVKSLDTFEFLAIPAVNKALVLELARGESGGYYLTSSDGKVYELSGKPDFSAHVNHTVTVTGHQKMMSKSDESKMEQDEKTEAGSKPYADLHVTSLKMVSDSCSQ